jgi:hypothetical protein
MSALTVILLNCCDNSFRCICITKVSVVHFCGQLGSNVLYFALIKSNEEPNFVSKILYQSKNKNYKRYYLFCFLVVGLGE